MDHLQTRLAALEQRTQTVERQLRWWRGLAGSLIVLAVLTWALPSGTAQEETTAGNRSLAQHLTTLEQQLRHLTLVTDAGEPPEMRITGANLRIINGLGSTDCTNDQGEPIPDCPNGVGNLIVGYNEPRPEGEENLRTGSHNVVVGQFHNFSRFGGIVVGEHNTISGNFASVSAGRDHTASGAFASVSGGEFNTASGAFASVSGGQANTASGERGAAVCGGENNTASGLFSVVSGGGANTASNSSSSISGGGGNLADGVGSSISGGINNVAHV